MVRPRKNKWVFFEPGVTYFKPQGSGLKGLKTIILGVDELESLRLSDLENLSQSEAADRMGVHQSTFQRTLSRARRKVSEALINGFAIKIHGGDYKMPNMDGTGPAGFGAGRGFGRGARGRAGAGFGRGFGRGAGRGVTSNTDGTCICPKCNYEEPHIPGEPCFKKKCPKCGTAMIRKPE